MSLANSMNNYPLKNIPKIWLVHRREHLEAHFQTVADLRDKLVRFTGSRNVVAVLEAAESLDHLIEQVKAMEEMFGARSLFSDDYNLYCMNDLRRLKELASSTSKQLQAIARQVSWGLSYDKQEGQVRRNLYPLIELLETILKWLEQVV